MEDKVEFKSIKDRIKFFAGKNNSNKPNVDNKNPAQTKSNKPNVDNKNPAQTKSNKPKVENKNTDNTNSNKAKADNKSIKKNISNNENNQNIQKFEKAKIIGDDLFEKKENMKIYKYPKKESSFKTGIAMKAKKYYF